MSTQVANGLLAVLFGSVIAVGLVVPVAAVLYRRRGAMPVGSLIILLAAAIYGVALWTYTLVPFPDTSDYTCTRPILEPFQSFRELRAHGVRTPQLLAANPYFWQTTLNVALFVPFGYFVRRVLGRGFLVAGVLGFTTSLLIETTQLTGVWGIFRCSYRFFEIDDLITNTSGAVLGSILSVVLVRRRPATQTARPLEVTRGRRWMGLVCDYLWTVGTAVGVTIALRAWMLYGEGGEVLDERSAELGGWLVAALLQAVVVLGAGRTLGEWTVALRTTGRGGWWTPVLRTAKYVLGVGGFVALSAGVAWWDGPGWVVPVFLLVTWVATWSGDHSGMANRGAGLRLRQ